MNEEITEELVDRVESLYIGGAQVSEIASELCVSNDIVLFIIKSHGLKRHNTAKKQDSGNHYYSYIMKAYQQGQLSKQEKTRALNRFYRNRNVVSDEYYEVTVDIKKHEE